jgi:hypothetical protein
MFWIIGSATEREVEELKGRGWEFRAVPPEVLASLRRASAGRDPGGSRPAPGKVPRPKVILCPVESSILDVLVSSGVKDRFDARERERIAALVGVLHEHGDEELLDEIVHDCHSRRAADVNNGGYESQVAFLASASGIEAVERQVYDWLRPDGEEDEGPDEGSPP